MRTHAFTIVLVVLLMALACNTAKNRATASSNNKGPSPTPIISLATPEGFTAVLEQRWPRESIVRFTTPGRRWWRACQNLVAIPHCERKGEVWEKDLFQGTATGFDRIWWYATVCDNKIQLYSLNASRGEDHWVIEVGDLEKLKTDPEIEPNSKQFCFEDGNHPRDK